jgi:hypothetical protein
MADETLEYEIPIYDTVEQKYGSETKYVLSDKITWFLNLSSAAGFKEVSFYQYSETLKITVKKTINTPAEIKKNFEDMYQYLIDHYPHEDYEELNKLREQFEQQKL